MRMFLKEYQQARRLRSMGLVEVLIALILIATTMVMAIRVVANGLKVAKENDMADSAAGIMLRAIEINQFDLTDLVSTWDSSPPYGLFDGGTFSCYTLPILDVEDTLVDLLGGNKVTSGCMGFPEIDSCTQASPYLVSSYQGAPICHQIILTNYPIGSYSGGSYNNNTIRITSIVVYVLDGKYEKQKIDTFQKY